MPSGRKISTHQMSRGIWAPRNDAKDEARRRIVSFYHSESLCECGVLLVKVTRAQCHARSFGLEWRLHVLATEVWHVECSTPLV